MDQAQRQFMIFRQTMMINFIYGVSCCCCCYYSLRESNNNSSNNKKPSVVINTKITANNSTTADYLLRERIRRQRYITSLKYLKCFSRILRDSQSCDFMRSFREMLQDYAAHIPTEPLKCSRNGDYVASLLKDATGNPGANGMRTCNFYCGMVTG